MQNNVEYGSKPLSIKDPLVKQGANDFVNLKLFQSI